MANEYSNSFINKAFNINNLCIVITQARDVLYSRVNKLQTSIKKQTRRDGGRNEQ